MQRAHIRLTYQKTKTKNVPVDPTRVLQWNLKIERIILIIHKEYSNISEKTMLKNYGLKRYFYTYFE